LITGKPIFDRSKGTREQWLELHDRHIGGSDAAAVMGISKWRSPMSVYVTKKHMLPHQEESSAMRWGNLLEDVVRKEFPRDFQLKEEKTVDVMSDTWMYEHPELSYLCADPDGFVTVDGQEGLGVLEIKTTTGRTYKDWADEEIPVDAYAQVQHNMHVLGLTWSLVVALMDKRIMWRIAPRRMGFIEEMLAAEEEWWKLYYLQDEMPAPSGLEIDTETLQGLYPTVAERELELPHLENIAIRFKELGEQAKAAEEERREIQQIFLQSMQDAKVAFAGKARASRSIFPVTRFDEKTFKADHPVIAARYLKESTQSRLTITVPKEKGAE
jgi:putative phage-type endonuclease